ncbi:MAG: PQQ-binding-like beta-propeller repeat protein [Planctomycetaceae bacterium]|nr:PQQ-like beta-propeller repeat protein [Planctomycetaceae bacterium]
MRASCIIGLLLAAIVLFPLPALAGGALAASDAADVTAQMDGLIEGARYEQCLALIARWQKEVIAGSDLRMVAWEIDFMNSEVDHAAFGKEHLYFCYCKPNSRAGAPGLKTNLASVEPSGSAASSHVVVCVEMRTGRILWSRPVEGLSRMAVDPATDTLYLIGQVSVIALPSDAGGPQVYPLEKGTRVIGLLSKSGIVLAAAAGLASEWNSQRSFLFSAALRSVVSVDLGQQAVLSPDEKTRLVMQTSSRDGFDNKIVCCRIADGSQLWSYQAQGFRGGAMPKFFDGDVIWMSGVTGQKAQAVRLSGSTGKVLWNTLVPNGAYKPGNPQGNMNPLMPLSDGRRLLAIDGRGTLHCLDPASGAITSTARPIENHLCTPAEVGDLMVFCGHSCVRAVPKATLTNRPGQRLDEREVLVRKARCLTGLGRLDEAMATLDYVLARGELCAAAWQARAAVCHARKDSLEESFSLCRYAQLSNLLKCPELRAWGLLGMTFLGSRPALQIAHAGGPELYVGTVNGDLWEIWPETLDKRLVMNSEKEIDALVVSSSFSICPSIGPADYATVAAVRSGSDRHNLFYRGKYYAALPEGKVRIAKDGHGTDLSSPLKGITTWHLHMSPSGPLGYGTGGIYELDEHLCPKVALMEQDPAGFTILSMRSLGDSLGVLTQRSDGLYLQVYGASDMKLRREVYLGRGPSHPPHDDQFVVLGEGYLFSDRQLTWVSGRPDGGVWQFGPPLRYTQRRLRNRWRYFSSPVVRDGRMLVAAIDGYVYGFDTAAILNSRPPAQDKPPTTRER